MKAGHRNAVFDDVWFCTRADFRNRVKASDVYRLGDPKIPVFRDPEMAIKRCRRQGGGEVTVIEVAEESATRKSFKIVAHKGVVVRRDSLGRWMENVSAWEAAYYF